MAIDDQQIVAISITQKPQVGYLRTESTWVNCPACQYGDWSRIQLDAVTYWQRFLHFTKLCKTCPTRSDVNHYCNHCGCYIGRYVPINCSERWLSRAARRQAAVDDMTLKTRPKDCAERAQKSREKVLAKRQKEREEKAAKASQTVVVTVQTK
ncbi:uncharacterized protein [Drosophila tropicalis]|uniref:uncharacterized protein n=1 Tax=Drosophila tropicalis TaxID=46794 RepID=UPI0035ABB98F